MSRATPWLIATAGLLLPACADDCDTSGCTAFERPAEASIQEGLAGSVAYGTDVVENGCEECGFSGETLRVWSADAPITDEAAANALVSSEPFATVNATGRYELALAPRYFVVCVMEQPCAAFTVVAGEVTTVNVKKRYGPTGLMIFDAGSEEPRSEEVFEFSAP